MFSRVCLKVLLSVGLWKHVMKSAGTEGHAWTERSDKEHRMY